MRTNIYPIPGNDIRGIINTFNLDALFTQVFGYKALPYQGIATAQVSKITEREKFDVARTTGKNSNLYASIEGRRVFLPVWLDGVLMPVCTIATECTNIIVSTPVNGGNGIVHELIRQDMWRIDLRGFAIGYKNEFPTDVITFLNELFMAKKALEMKCAVTDLLLHEYKVVVQKLKFPEVRGSEHVVAFEMTLVEDKEIQLLIQ
ncbi:MAG: DUF6046 domain-containing protein [Bacteroidales bacterium]